jgi:hypothetical protein
MDFFWVGLILVVVLIYSVVSIALILLWRRASIRKMETALAQLQNELIRVNSLLEKARSRILGAGSDLEGQAAPGEQTALGNSEVKD